MKKVLKTIKTIFFTFLAKKSLGQSVKTMKANGFTKLTKQTRIGKNVNFNGLVIYGKGKCTIGDNFHSGFGCKILTSYHDYEGKAIPYDNNLITRDVIIEDNVWLGINVTILSGVTLGEGCIVQAGSVVVSDIKKCGIAGGHPAKVFAMRNEKHYYKLKDEGKFY